MSELALCARLELLTLSLDFALCTRCVRELRHQRGMGLFECLFMLHIDVIFGIAGVTES